MQSYPNFWCVGRDRIMNRTITSDEIYRNRAIEKGLDGDGGLSRIYVGEIEGNPYEEVKIEVN